MATATKEPDARGLTLAYWQRDLPASIVVFLVALPLCMGVALASGAPISTGLVTGIVGGLIVGFLSGSPLQVSGPAAGLTVIVFSLIQTFGIERLGICVLAAGALQLAAGYLRLGQWFRAVSPAVIQGMLAGIGVLIFASQFHVMLDDKPRHSGIENLMTIPHAVAKIFPVAPLGDTAQRQAETAELHKLGKLHQSQREVLEAVHHRLSGITSEQIAIAKDKSPKDTIAQVDTDEERALGVQLQDEQLLASQKAILTELEAFQHPKSAKQFAAARAAVQTAITDLNQGDIFSARQSQDEAEAAVQGFLNARKNHGWAAIIGIMSILTILSWKIVARGNLKVIPAALMAVLVTALVAYFVDLPVLYVEVPTNLTSEIYFPRFAEFMALLDPLTWVFVAQLAVIASAETLLCASAVDRLHNGVRTDYDRELRAQGFGNIICGLLCALPMTGVIVRSSANLQAGAKTRLSSILHGMWLLLFVVAFAWLLRNIPTATLAGILVYSGFKLVDVRAARALVKRGYSELGIYLATVIAIVCTDLLIGVLFGLALSLAKLIYVFSRLEIDVEPDTTPGKRVIHLRGSATFLRIPALAETLEKIPNDCELHVDVSHLDYIDAACLEMLEAWEVQNAETGGRLVIDSDSLQTRFWRKRAAAIAAQSHENGNGNGHDNGHGNGNGQAPGLLQHRQKQRPI